MAAVKKLAKIETPPRVITMEDIDLHGAIEDAFRALEATTLMIDRVLDALQEAKEIARLASRADGRAKHVLLVHRYGELVEKITETLTALAKGPVASGNAALAITLAQTGMVDEGLTLDLPATMGSGAAEARQTLMSLELAMRAAETYAGHFRDTARHLVDHRSQNTVH